MSPSPVPAMSPVPEVAGAGDKRQPRSRRSSNVSLGRRSRLSSEVGEAIGEKVQAVRELRSRLNSLRNDNSMRSSFDIGEFLEEKEFDIVGKTYKDIFPII